jgi:hypothetical protein
LFILSNALFASGNDLNYHFLFFRFYFLIRLRTQFSLSGSKDGERACETCYTTLKQKGSQQQANANTPMTSNTNASNNNNDKSSSSSVIPTSTNPSHVATITTTATTMASHSLPTALAIYESNAGSNTKKECTCTIEPPLKKQIWYAFRN